MPSFSTNIHPGNVVLAIDTASPIQALALTRGQDILFEAAAKPPTKDGKSLLSLVDAALKYCALSIHDVERLVVSRGPGAFTGLRVSMAMLKAFALTRNIPLYAASSLEAIACQASPFEGILAPCIDARRGEIYAAFFRQTPNGLKNLTDELLLKPSDFAQIIDTHFPQIPILCLGPAFPNYQLKLTALSPHLVFPLLPTPPSASALAHLILERYPNTPPDVALESLEPRYIRMDDFALPTPFDFTKPEQFRMRT